MATPIQQVINEIKHGLTKDKTLKVDLEKVVLSDDAVQALCHFFDSLKLPEDHHVDFGLYNANMLPAKLIKHIFQFLRREKISSVRLCSNLTSGEHLDTYAKELKDFIQKNPLKSFSLIRENTLNFSKIFHEILLVLSDNVSLKHLEFEDMRFQKEAFETLSAILSKIPLVKLHFYSCTVYRDQFPELIDHLHKIKSLNSLKLEDFSFFDGLCPKTRKIAQIQVIELILNHPALEFISIFMPVLFCDFVLNEHDEYLKRLTKPNLGLKTLCLGGTELNDDAVDVFVKILGNLPNLMSIVLSQIDLTPSNVNKVVAALEKHPKLLYIGFAIHNTLNTLDIELGGHAELAYLEHYDKAYARLLNLKHVKNLSLPIAGMHTLEALKDNQTLQTLVLVNHSKNSIFHSYFSFIDGLLPVLQKNRTLLDLVLPSPYGEAEIHDLMQRNNKLHRNKSRQSWILALSAAYGVKLSSRDRPFKDIFPLIFAFLGMPVKGKELYAKTKDVRSKLSKERPPQKPDQMQVGSKTLRMLDDGEVLKLYEDHCTADHSHQRLPSGEPYCKKRRIELNPKPITPAFSAKSQDFHAAMDIEEDDTSSSAFSADPEKYIFSFSDFNA